MEKLKNLEAKKVKRSELASLKGGDEIEGTKTRATSYRSQTTGWMVRDVETYVVIGIRKVAIKNEIVSMNP